MKAKQQQQEFELGKEPERKEKKKSLLLDVFSSYLHFHNLYQETAKNLFTNRIYVLRSFN